MEKFWGSISLFSMHSMNNEIFKKIEICDATLYFPRLLLKPLQYASAYQVNHVKLYPILLCNKNLCYDTFWHLQICNCPKFIWIFQWTLHEGEEFYIHFEWNKKRHPRQHWISLSNNDEVDGQVWKSYLTVLRLAFKCWS